MNLNTSNWKPFQIDKMFDIYTGGDLIMGEIIEGDIPIASNSAENNNIAAYTSIIPGRKLFDHTKSISIADRGKFWAFIQAKDFYIATRVKALVCKDYNILNIYQLSFVVSVLNQESFKFAYGRNCCANLPFIKISLPIQYELDGTPVIDNLFRYSDEGYVPDWQWMEKYIKSLHHKPLTTTMKQNTTLQLNVDKWMEFKVSDVLICDSTKLSIKDNLSDGETPFISRTAEDNGCDGYVEVGIDQITRGNCLTIGAEGIYSFYQPVDFATGNKVYQLRNEYMNPYVGLFLSTVLNIEDYRYSYGRARILGKLKDEIIKLPIVRNEDGMPFIDDTHKYSGEGYIPDWQWMEDYIKSLPYGDRI